MPKYIYRAKTKDAKTVKGQENVSSRAELAAKLKAKGLFVISLEEVKEKPKGAPLFSIFSSSRGKRSGLRIYDLALFARNLSTTLSSGVTLLRSLEIIAHQTESLKLDNTLKACHQDIKNGLSFSDAAARYPNVFSTLWTGIIRVGETSGNLPFVLDKLADYLELRMEFERKIKSALVYPAILMVISGGALLFFLKVIFPKFKGLFEQFGMELPAITRYLFTASGIVEKNFLLIIGFIILVIFSVVVLRKNPSVRGVWDVYSLKLPYFGNMFFLIFLERLTSTVNILLESGLPLVYTIEISAQSIGNFVLEKRLLSVGQKVKDGHSLSDEFRNEGIFPLLISEMVAIGEETGSMPEVFQKVSTHYRKQLVTRVERFIAAFEPMMILVMGVVIGGIVISLFLPLFKIATLSKQ